MNRTELLSKRSRLEELLRKYESGEVTHLDADDRGFGAGDSTEDRCAMIKGDIADVDRILARD